MDFARSSSDLQRTSGSMEHLLKEENAGNSVPYGHRNLEHSDKTTCLLASDYVPGKPTVPIYSRSVTTRSMSSLEELTLPLLSAPSADKADEHLPGPGCPEPEPDNELVCTTQPSSRIPKGTNRKGNQEERELDLDIDNLMSLLKQIRGRDSFCDGIAARFKVIIHDCSCCTTGDEPNIDSDWLRLLKHDLQTIKTNIHSQVPNRERVALAIQQLLFTVILFQSHYHSEESKASCDALSQLEQVTMDIVKFFYLHFEESWLAKLLNNNAYRRKSLKLKAMSYSFEVVKETLRYHLHPNSDKYQPAFITDLLQHNLTKKNINKIFNVTEVEDDLAKKRKDSAGKKLEMLRLKKLFTNHPLKRSLVRSTEFTGLTNFHNTCFISAPLIGFIHFYLPCLTCSQPSGKCDGFLSSVSPAGRGTGQVTADGGGQWSIEGISRILDVLKSEGVRLRSERDRLQQASDQISIAVHESGDQPSLDASEFKKLQLEHREAMWRDCFTQGVVQCLRWISSLFQSRDITRMNNVYQLLLNILIEAARHGAFYGFEDFQGQLNSKFDEMISQSAALASESGVLSTNNRHAPVTVEKVAFTPDDLSPQDCAEFFLCFLQVIPESCYPPDLAYYEMIEKKITNGEREATIVKFDKIGHGAASKPAKTLIYTPSVSAEQSKKAGFSLQMILDEQATFNHSGDPQNISIEAIDFKYVIGSSGVEDSALMPKAGINGNNTPGWILKAQRTILVAAQPPELVIVQLALPGDFYERAAIAERLLKDRSPDVVLTFRHSDTLEDQVQTYEKVCTIFHAEHCAEIEMGKHYRASIKHPQKSWLLFDDLNVYPIPENHDVNTDCGAPSMYILKKKSVG